jgi:hypothetical protein
MSSRSSRCAACFLDRRTNRPSALKTVTFDVPHAIFCVLARISHAEVGGTACTAPGVFEQPFLIRLRPGVEISRCAVG